MSEIENRKVDSKLEMSNRKPVYVYKQAIVEKLPKESSLLYGEFLDFFYKPVMVEPVAAVVIWKSGEPLGFGFINRAGSDGLHTCMPLQSELAKLVEMVRKKHSDCHRGCQLLGTGMATAMGLQENPVGRRLPNFPDASRYYRPATAQPFLLEQMPYIPIPTVDSDRVSEICQGKEFDLVTIDVDRVKGLCGFGFIAVPCEGANDPDQFTRTVRKIARILGTGMYPQDGEMQQPAAAIN